MAIATPMPPTTRPSDLETGHRNGRQAAIHRPRVGVVKFASCDGCQLTILDLEDQLLALTDRFEFIEFAEATSRRSSGPFDVLFVEGSISTPEQAVEIARLRAAAKTLVTIGACATAGGIQALRTAAEHPAFRAAVYPAPSFVDSLDVANPVSSYVQVDAELRGCPIDPGQLVELLTALTTGRRPQLPDQAVCLECKRRGVTCVVVARGIPCLGPVTRTGCGAICPRFGRGCYGCFGPRENANVTSLARGIKWHGGRSDSEIGRLFAGFTGATAPFRAVTDELAGRPARALRPALAHPPELAHEGPPRWPAEGDASRDGQPGGSASGDGTGRTREGTDGPRQ